MLQTKEVIVQPLNLIVLKYPGNERHCKSSLIKIKLFTSQQLLVVVAANFFIAVPILGIWST